LVIHVVNPLEGCYDILYKEIKQGYTIEEVTLADGLIKMFAAVMMTRR